MKKVAIFTVVLLLVLAGIGYFFRENIIKRFFEPTHTKIQDGINNSNLNTREADSDTAPTSSQTEDIKILVEDLDIPWEIVYLPSGEILVTERPGTLLKIGEDRHIVQQVEGVAHVGEGGLMGMVLHPNFEDNNWIYLYLTTRTTSGLINRVERYEFDGERLINKETILDNIPGAANHDGGRIAFGPDGKLYITTGDAQNVNSAQDTESLSGKILRLNEDGSIPEDNPFGNEVWSYGHRNPQGLAWDDQGRLWATEHGPSGILSGYDELNLIEKGGNYGWPEIRGDQAAEGMISPVINSGANDTWAPAGAVFYNGSIFFTGLRGSALYEAKLNGTDVVELIAHFRNDYGRMRALVITPDGLLNVSTSNTDGRGNASPSDDIILSIRPDIFFVNLGY